MDLWHWVNETEERLREQGQTRLADLVDRIPHDVCEDRHDRVDACVTEALALAKGVAEPWLELFLRHWWLQSRILHRMDGTALGDAVHLVELAHREETRACPQAVCAVQDLAAAYGHVDGPGYAAERLAVAAEAFEKIDTSWSCYTCIASEHAAALHDQGQYAESLAFLDQRAAQLMADGRAAALDGLARARVGALLGLGRYDEALAFVDDDDKNGRRHAHERVHRRLERARLLVRASRAKEARQALPTVAEVRPTPLFYGAWVDAATALVAAGEMDNDATLGATLQEFIERLDRQGVGHTTLVVAEAHGTLALARGAPHVAQRALDAMARASTRLHRPLAALDRIGRLRAAIAAAPRVSDVVVPETPELVLAALEKGDDGITAARDVEENLLLLEAAHMRFPGDASVALALSACQLAAGLARESVATLDAFHGRTGDDEALLRLGTLLLSRPDELGAVVERHRLAAKDDYSRVLGDWLLARAAHAGGEWKACLAHLDVVLRARPDANHARAMYADVARRLGDWTTALAKLDEIVERVPEGGPADWDRMSIATIVGDFDRVRASAARLGIALEGTGPIDQRMGHCRIRFDDGRDAWALRISPVAARIVDIALPPRVQRFGDVVVFDAVPLNPPPAPGEEPSHRAPVFPWMATLIEGKYRAYPLDGVHPGKAIVDALAAAAKALGGELHTLSGDDYRVGDERGLYAAVALPGGASEAALCAGLVAVLGDRRLVFVELARAAGDPELAARHAALASELGL